MKLPKNLELIEYKPVRKYDPSARPVNQYTGFIAIVYNKNNNLYEVYVKSDRWFESKTDIINYSQNVYSECVDKCIKLNNFSIMRKFFSDQLYALITTVKANSDLSIEELENKLIDYLDFKF